MSQSISDQDHGKETWPFLPDDDLDPTGDLALEQHFGPTETVSQSGGFLTTIPASSHFPTGAVPHPAQTLCTSNSVLASSS